MAKKKEEIVLDAQRSLEWHRDRLGMITGSEVGKLMGKTRKKDEVFTATAKSYINKKVGERMMNPSLVMDDEWFADWVEKNDITTRAIQYGIDNEPMAKQWLELETGVKVEDIGSVVHPKVEYFSASPDGICEIDGKKYVVEVKCPEHARFVEYFDVEDGKSLKEINAEYYWQVVAEMAVTDAVGCLFLTYRDDQKNPLHVARIERNEEAIDALMERVELADEEIRRKVEGCLMYNIQWTIR